MAKSIMHILRKTGSYKVKGSLWIECDETRFLARAGQNCWSGLIKPDL